MQDWSESTPVHSIRGEAPFALPQVLTALEKRKTRLPRRLLSMLAQIYGKEDNTWRAAREGLRYPTKITTSDGKTENMPHEYLELAAQADGLGFRYIGTAREGITPEGVQYDVWISKDDTAYLLRTKNASGDPLVRTKSRYALFTFFEDGICLETHSNDEEPSEPSPFVMVMQGANVLATDWPMHQAKAQEYVRLNRRALLRVSDHAMVLRLMRFYIKHLIAEQHARTIFYFLGIIIVIGIVALFVLDYMLKDVF